MGTRVKKKRGLIQQARDIITEKIGGFGKLANRQAAQRQGVSQPFTGAPGQRERRKVLIGKGTPSVKTKPIIKKASGDDLTTLEEKIQKRNRELRRVGG